MVLFLNPLIVPVGLVIGVLIAVPVGPVNILCVQRTLERGFWGGVAAGTGAVLGDGLIALSAGLGVGAISALFEVHRATIQILGGLVLVGFGVKLFGAPPRLAPSEARNNGTASVARHLWDIPKTFLLTVTNPAAVLGLFAIFGGVSAFVTVATVADAFAMTAAIMVGSLAWWITLSHLIGRFRHRLPAVRLRHINRAAGVLLALSGALLVGEIVFKMVHGS